MSAIKVRNGYKYYGSGSSKRVVLDGLNMTVQSGTIYGLLGASGCGKTTLLSCLVGQKQLNHGEIRVLGLNPGKPGSGIPGPRIGYMPQEIALVAEMTVKETIFYFGRICGLKEEKIIERFNLLNNILELPPKDQLIRQCSGGQQRRVSFASAMVHNPPLLILDEPTVGLDPILREKIWDFLVQSTSHNNITVIITTHYIEEAKQANCIGLMRNGILLAEDSPEGVLRRFETTSIENAFLILSERQEKLEKIEGVHQKSTMMLEKPTIEESSVSGDYQMNDLPGVVNSSETNYLNLSEKSQAVDKSIINNNNNNNNHNNNNSNDAGVVELEKSKSCWKFTTKVRLKALLSKNLVQMLRHPGSLIITYLLPIFHLGSFYLAVGNDPVALKLGIVNSEILNPSECLNQTVSFVKPRIFEENENECELHKISCRYLNEFYDSYAVKVYYDTEEEALKASKKSEIIGYINFASNFSESVEDLLKLGLSVDESTFKTSRLNIRLDMSNYQLLYYIQKRLIQTFNRFIENLMVECGYPKEIGKTALKFEEPIYGSIEDQWQRYLAPGLITTMVYFFACLTTASVFINDRLDGTWDRTLVSGISTMEMLLSHLICHSALLLLQCVEVMVYITLVFNVENKGEQYIIILFLILSGFSGMLFGLIISIFCKTHTLANFVGTGAFYPMILLCGLIWPVEALPNILQKVAYILPFTIPTVSYRNVLEKGWTISNFQVSKGFLVIGFWIAIKLIVCVVGLKARK